MLNQHVPTPLISCCWPTLSCDFNLDLVQLLRSPKKHNKKWLYDGPHFHVILMLFTQSGFYGHQRNTTIKCALDFLDSLDVHVIFIF